MRWSAMRPPVRNASPPAASAPPTDKIFSVYRRDAQLPPISSTYMVIVKKGLL